MRNKIKIKQAGKGSKMIDEQEAGGQREIENCDRK